MNENQKKIIKNVADELTKYIKTKEDVKILKKLETTTSYGNYRSLLKIVIKNRISSNIENPLFTFDDYVNYLFPEGNLTWKETRDLIFFRIYEKLQPWIIEQKNNVK